MRLLILFGKWVQMLYFNLNNTIVADIRFQRMGGNLLLSLQMIYFSICAFVFKFLGLECSYALFLMIDSPVEGNCCSEILFFSTLSTVQSFVGLVAVLLFILTNHQLPTQLVLQLSLTSLVLPGKLFFFFMIFSLISEVNTPQLLNDILFTVIFLTTNVEFILHALVLSLHKFVLLYYI